MNKTTKLILVAIFILGLFLRFYRLNLNLPELYIDETAGQYFMRTSVLHSELIPSSAVQRLFYNSLSFTWFLGLNPLGARSAASLFSSLIPLSAFLFFKQIKHKSNLAIALSGAFLAAILPWSFLIGRIAHVHIPIIVSLTCLSSFYFLTAQKLRHYFYSLFFLGLAAFYYPSVIFITPFMASLILYYASKQLSPSQRRQLTFAISILTIIVIAVFAFKYRGLNPSSRGVDLAIWRDPNTVYDTNQNRGLSWLSDPTLFSLFTDPKNLAPLIYNKATANLGIFVRNYLSFFSPDWLFLRGDAILRHSSGQMGYLYPVLLPFLLYGAFRFFKTADKKTQLLFLVWILASPLTGAVTKDGAGYLLRAITLFPFLTYFIALGLVESLTFLKSVPRFIYSLILALLVSYSAFYFYFDYFHAYPYRTSTAHAYEYGFSDLSDFQVENNNSTLLIVWDGYYPYGHFLFWQKILPKEYAQYQFEDIVINNSHFYHPLPKLYFVKPYQSKDISEFVARYHPDYLVLPDRYYINYPDDLVKESEQPIKIISYPNGEPNFTIYRL